MPAKDNNIQKLAAISKCTRILNENKKIKSSIEQVLQEILNFYKGERVYVFEFSDDELTFSNTYEFCAKNVVPQIDKLQKVPVSIADEWMENFLQKKPVIIESVKNITDRKRSEEKDILAEQDIESLISVPLYYEGKLHGFLGVDNPSVNTVDHEFLAVLGSVITGESLRRRMILDREKSIREIQEVLNSSVCGIAKLCFAPSVSVIFANTTYYAMRGCHTIADKIDCNTNPLKYVHPGDIDRIRLAIRDAIINKRQSLEFQCRVISKKGKVRFLKRDCQIVHDSDGTVTALLTDVDITERVKNEHLLDIEKHKLNIALSAVPDFFMWEYDIKSEEFKLSDSLFNVEEKLSNGESIQDALVKQSIVKDDYPVMYDLHRRLKTGETEITADIRRKVGNYPIEWRRIKYFTIPNENNDSRLAIGTSYDITAEKFAEQRYNEQLSFRNYVEKDIIGSFKLNLTKNIIVEQRSTFPEIMALAESGTASGFFKNISDYISNEDARKRFSNKYTVKNLIRQFNAGKNSIVITQKFDILGKHEYWLQASVDLIQNPITGDIECLAHAKDVDAQTTTALFLDNLADKDYLLMMLIDGNTKAYTLISTNKESLYNIKDGSNIDSYWHQLYSSDVLSKDESDDFYDKFNIDNIIAELENTDVYKLYLSTNKDGVFYRTKHSFSFLNKNTKQICYAITDITDLFEQEQQRNKNLESALLSAEQASKYKGEFMTRISHEIRTPLNAIVGYTVISKNAVEHSSDDFKALPVVNQLRNNLVKSETASKHLLEIINEVLDLSSIESGKKHITNVAFNIIEMLQAVADIFRHQAKEKNIKFGIKLNKITNENVVGDNLHLNQILVNLLSNAVKFTPEGGSVTFTVTQTVTHEDEVYFSFEVKDTGVGMSKEFMKNLYKPFVQEMKKDAYTYGGTGLGLAITRNLISLLHGSIRAESEVGKGSVFTTEIPLKIDSADENSNHIYSFNNANVAIIDLTEDEGSNIPELLKRCGFSSFSLYNSESIALFPTENVDYNVVLLECDSFSSAVQNTVRRLRPLLNDNTYFAVITIFDDEFDADTTASDFGLSGIVYKPLYSSTLFDMLVDSYCSQPTKTVDKHSGFDFTNLRVLLVEDNDMNREIALEILSYTGIKVDTAVNGKIAVGMFEESEPFYYDAVLMDIIMPEMDGYAATRAMRNSNREDAASVPIIAMSANAFVEDVAKSLEAGMNNHISKPIDVKTLFKTLETYIKQAHSTINR